MTTLATRLTFALALPLVAPPTVALAQEMAREKFNDDARRSCSRDYCAEAERKMNVFPAEEPLLWWRQRMREYALAAGPINDKGNEHFKAGKYHEAATCYRMAADKCSIGLGPDDESVAEVQENYGAVLRRVSRAIEAEFWEQLAAEIRKASAEKKGALNDG